MEKNQEQQMPVKKRSLTDQEKLSIARVKKRHISKNVPLYRINESDCKDTLELSYDKDLEHNDAVYLFESRVLDVTGSANSDVGLQLLNNVGKAIVSGKAGIKDFVKQMGTIALSMQAMAPQDEFEGQLIAQLVVLHEHAMEWLGKAMRTDRVDFSNVYLNGASKLLTRHHETLEALLKYRRKGEQRVHVEHVHVHGGGQAIVGNVTTGGGMNQKFEEGPHAKV